ncbi:peptidoglycan-binding domain-containing protein [Kitasatospora arboriphila]
MGEHSYETLLEWESTPPHRTVLPCGLRWDVARMPESLGLAVLARFGGTDPDQVGPVLRDLPGHRMYWFIPLGHAEEWQRLGADVHLLTRGCFLVVPHPDMPGDGSAEWEHWPARTGTLTNPGRLAATVAEALTTGPTAHAWSEEDRPIAAQPDRTIEHTEDAMMVRPYVLGPSAEPRPAPVHGRDLLNTTILPLGAAAPTPARPVPALPAPFRARTAAAHPVPPMPPTSEPPLPNPPVGLTEKQHPDDRAGRRHERKASRRRSIITRAGLGIVAVGVGIALLPASSGEDGKKSGQALPLPSSSPWIQPPTDPSPNAVPSPGAVSSAETASASAAPGDTAAAAPRKAPTTRTLAPQAVFATTARTAAPSTPTPTPTRTPTSTPTPAAAAMPRTLRPGDTGTDVMAMQQLLVTVSCGNLDKSLVTGTFDDSTENAVTQYQRRRHIKGETGVYGPKTRAALQAEAQDQEC